jgi:hypothetical protein
MSAQRKKNFSKKINIFFVFLFAGVLALANTSCSRKEPESPKPREVPETTKVLINKMLWVEGRKITPLKGFEFRRVKDNKFEVVSKAGAEKGITVFASCWCVAPSVGAKDILIGVGDCLDEASTPDVVICGTSFCDETQECAVNVEIIPGQ